MFLPKRFSYLAKTAFVLKKITSFFLSLFLAAFIYVICYTFYEFFVVHFCLCNFPSFIPLFWIFSLLQEKNVKLIDATYTLRPDFPDWKTFHDNYYGDFKKLIDAFVSFNYPFFFFLIFTLVFFPRFHI